jgi:uncharacterized surface protein with fasciclin (FAS1) repeats
MRRIITTLIGLSMLMAVMAAPAAAQQADTNWWGDKGYENKGNLVEELIALNDKTGRYDILIEAVLFADANSDVELVELLATTPDITLFAPTDYAFVKLARSLTGDDSIRQSGAFEAIAGVLVEAGGGLEGAVELLIDTLSYHVAPEIIKPWQLFFYPYKYEMLNGDELIAKGLRLIDEADNRSKVQLLRSNNKANNPALIHTINNVLIPSSLAG